MTCAQKTLIGDAVSMPLSVAYGTDALSRRTRQSGGFWCTRSFAEADLNRAATRKYDAKAAAGFQTSNKDVR